MKEDWIKKRCSKCRKIVVMLKPGSRMLPGTVFICNVCNTTSKSKPVDLPEGFDILFGGFR